MSIHFVCAKCNEKVPNVVLRNGKYICEDCAFLVLEDISSTQKGVNPVLLDALLRLIETPETRNNRIRQFLIDTYKINFETHQVIFSAQFAAEIGYKEPEIKSYNDDIMVSVHIAGSYLYLMKRQDLPIMRIGYDKED